MRKRSTKKVKSLEEIVLPFETTFPVTIEGGVNSDTFKFPKNTKVTISKKVYEAIAHSSYAKYLSH